MKVSLREMVENGDVSADTVAVLHGAAALQVVQALLTVQRAAAARLAGVVMDRPSLDLREPARHVLTLTGEVEGLKMSAGWIEEATEIVTGKQE